MVYDMARPKNKKYHMDWNAWERCCKKVDSQGEHLHEFTIDFTGIQFIANHNSQANGQNKCKEWDELAQEDQTYRLTLEEQKRYQGQWYLFSNKASTIGLLKLRFHFQVAVLLENRLHHEPGEQVEELIHPDRYRRWYPSWYTSWWDKSDWNWKRAHFLFIILDVTVGFVCNRWRSIVTDWGVDRNISHVIFLIFLTHVMTLTSWPKVSQVRIRSTHVPSMMSHDWACVVCLRVV